MNTRLMHHKISILSSFGSGDWLALQLRERGFTVYFYDFSHLLGQWTPEDWEGPFGLLRDKSVNPSQVSHFFEGESVEESERGFCFWLPEGPLELKGPLYRYSKNSRLIHPDVEHYLRNAAHVSVEEKRHLQVEVDSLPYRSAWPVYFSHQFASNSYGENCDAITANNSHVSLFSSFFYRSPSRRGLADAFQKLIDQGVHCFQNFTWKKLHVVRKKIEKIEIEVRQQAQLQECDQVISFLSMADWQFIDSEAKKEIFGDFEIVPAWYWSRFRFELSPEELLSELPVHCVSILDLELPWAYDNMAVLIKNYRQSEMDIWIRYPHRSRFDKMAIEAIEEKLKIFLQNKFPDSEIKKLQFPQEYKYDFSQLGPVRFPVYFLKDIKPFPKPQIRNFHFAGVESRSRLDILSIWEEELRLLEKSRKWVEEETESYEVEL